MLSLEGWMGKQAVAAAGGSASLAIVDVNAAASIQGGDPWLVPLLDHRAAN